MCNILSNLLAKINILIHKYVLIGVKSPLPIIWIILLSGELQILMLHFVHLELFLSLKATVASVISQRGGVTQGALHSRTF